MPKKLKRTANPPSPGPTGSANWLLFKHMADNHGLTLLESELDEISRVVIEMRPGIDLKGFTAKQWAEIRRSYRNTPNTKLSGGGPLSNKTTEAESRRPLE